MSFLRGLNSSSTLHVCGSRQDKAHPVFGFGRKQTKRMGVKLKRNRTRGDIAEAAPQEKDDRAILEAKQAQAIKTGGVRGWLSNVKAAAKKAMGRWG